MQPAAFFVLMRWHCFFDAVLVFVATALACFFACGDIVFCLLQFDAALCFVAMALAWLFLLPWLWHGCFSPAAVFFGGRGVVFWVFVAAALA